MRITNHGHTIARWCLSTILLTLMLAISRPAAATQSFAAVIDGVQPKMVKIYGAGGGRGLEAYQSGFLISAEGHILTVASYVLDTDYVTAVLNDGQRFPAKYLGADPRVEIAVLKIDATELDHFDLEQATDMLPGARVLAFSNLFNVAVGNEPASVLHGNVAAKTQLTARRGAFATAYHGSAYVLDAMTNNPGAGGGALTDRQGNLAGLLGKEMKNRLDNTWLNYAIPIHELRESVSKIISGEIRVRSKEPDARKPPEAVSLALLGIVMVPDVLQKTPPFIDRLRPGLPAAKAGLKPDDMILYVNDQLAGSTREFKESLSFIDRIDEVRLLVQRGQELIEVSLFVPEP